MLFLLIVMLLFSFALVLATLRQETGIKISHLILFIQNVK